ncbi:MAG: LCP family protein [Clostridiales bacterium]|nr:LCP family protein [Clostridiales bacterium]
MKNQNHKEVQKPQMTEAEKLHIAHVDSKGHKVNASKVNKSKKVKKPWTFKRVMLKIVLPIVLVLAIIAGGLYIAFIQYKKHLLNQIEFIPKQENPTFINEEGSVVTLSHYTSETYAPPIEEEHVHNFLLIGIDSRSRDYSSDGSGDLADVIMVMSVDDSAGTIKLLTIQRDCYVNIPGYKKLQKINAAMTFGGPELLKTVIQNHLRLTIDGYAYVNFYHMEEVIDAVGGIDIELTRSEVFHDPGGLNDNLRELNSIHGVSEETYFLDSAGMQHLNGRQAVAYSRIRMVGNGVYARSERQVKVLNELLNKYVNMSTTSQLSALDDILKMIATDISPDEIEKYAFDFLPNVKNLSLETMGIPVDGYYVEGVFSDDIRPNDWSIRADWNGMIPLVQDFFYGETYPFDEVPHIPRAPEHDVSDLMIPASSESDS